MDTKSPAGSSDPGEDAMLAMMELARRGAIAGCSAIMRLTAKAHVGALIVTRYGVRKF